MEPWILHDYVAWDWGVQEIGETINKREETVARMQGGVSNSGWPLVGNEEINFYIGILGIHSLIPY